MPIASGRAFSDRRGIFKSNGNYFKCGVFDMKIVSTHLTALFVLSGLLSRAARAKRGNQQKNDGSRFIA